MSFTFKAATISARALTIADDNEIDLLCFRLGDDTNMYNAQKWAEFVVAAQVDGNNPVPFASSKSTPEEARYSFRAWVSLPRSFMQSWRSELRSAEGSPLDA